ncbi:PAS domain S-box protein [Candidatus Margulisiibacteriota bacterium]
MHKKIIAGIRENTENKDLKELCDFISFTENVSLKIHGLKSKDEVFQVLSNEFSKSTKYCSSILLLTDDDQRLKLLFTSASPTNEIENPSNTKKKDYTFNLDKSKTYSHVIKEGLTVQASSEDITYKLLPRPITFQISKTHGQEKIKNIITPIYFHRKIIGAFSVNSPVLSDYCIPSVKNLSRHITSALELAYITSEHYKLEKIRNTSIKNNNIINCIRDLMNENIDDIQSKNTLEILSEKLDKALVILSTKLDLGQASIMYFNKDKGRLEIIGSYGIWEVTKEKVNNGEYDTKISNFVFQNEADHSLIINNEKELHQFNASHKFNIALERSDSSSVFLSHRLAIEKMRDNKGNALGVINFSKREKPFENNELELITTTANFLTQVINNTLSTEKLRISEEKHRHLLEALHEGVWNINKDSYTTYVNPRMADILGYTIDEMIGKSLFSFLDEQGVKFAKRYIESGKHGTKKQYEIEFIRKNGTRVFTLIETSPIFDINGNYIGSLSGVQDITKRIEAEIALSKSNENLLEKTIDLEQIISIVHHDILNNMGAFTTYLKLLKENEVDEQGKINFSELDLLEMSAQSSIKTLETLRVWSKIGRESIKINPVDMRIVMSEIKNEYEGLKILDKDILTFDENLHVCMAERNLLHYQVIENLINNSRRYKHPERPLKIHLSSKIYEGFVIYCLEDNGIGIKSNLIERIFEFQYQIKDNVIKTMTNGSGQGIGLSVVMKIVRIFGGDVWAESEYGKWTRIYISLPIP